ncbi:MAG TPA: MMPL family transporter [Geminicoccaceae bacterium]|nr:MMPL family transporter [Geminicoccaceae bacterium]
MAATVEQAIFGCRALIVALFAVTTLSLAYQATHLRIDAGFAKRLPHAHPYVSTFLHYREAFGGADRMLIAVRSRDGDIFSPRFFETLREVTDAVFFLPGIDRSSVRSLYTPNVRFVEIVESGFAGSNVIPAEFQPTEADLEQVRENILKAGLLGDLVANDFSAALIRAELLEDDPRAAGKLDYLEIAAQLERSIRTAFVNDAIDIHIIGFAKAMGDIADGAIGVIAFFGATFLITAILVYAFLGSIAHTVLILLCPIVAIVWTLGLLPLLGLGLDPMSILLPFLIFAIGVSHGIQMVAAYDAEIGLGADASAAARLALHRLLVPGGTALLSDMLGFLTIALIQVRILQELAIAAALGVLAVSLTNLLLLPMLLSLVHGGGFAASRVARVDGLYRLLAGVARPRGAAITLLGGLLLLAWGISGFQTLRLGDLTPGIAELRPESRYNQDSAYIASHFAIGVDILQVMAETAPNGCVDHDIMAEIDRFQWHMTNVPGVRSTLSLPQLAKTIHAGWNEGSLKWRVLPRNESSLGQAIGPIETGSGLLNADCSVMPVLIFSQDHQADTIDRIIAAAESYAAASPSERLTFRLASGNLAMIAATNDVVEAAQFPILLYVYAAIIGLCLLTFWSVRAVLCIVLPLCLVSVLVYALMAALGIGLTLSTLPVAALAVGIGIDYGIYIYARLERFLDRGLELAQAYRDTLRVTGKAVMLTGLTLSLGVGSWVFSALQFQADMGILLGFAFLANMLGALLLLPALAFLTDRIGRRRG